VIAREKIDQVGGKFCGLDQNNSKKHQLLTVGAVRANLWGKPHIRRCLIGVESAQGQKSGVAIHKSEIAFQ
jgi:hypothetical protein